MAKTKCYLDENGKFIEIAVGKPVPASYTDLGLDDDEDEDDDEELNRYGGNIFMREFDEEEE